MNENTRERILDSASKMFTMYGFAGTSTVDIAKLANVSQGLIFHYFGSKENLWKEVNRSVNQNFNQQLIHIPDLRLPFVCFVEELVRAWVEIALKNKRELRFSVWQQLENIEAEELKMLPVNKEQLKKAFSYYQERGEIDPGLNTKHILKFFIGAIRSMIFDLLLEKNLQSYEQYLSFYAMRISRAFI